jgi:hypothetical protein
MCFPLHSIHGSFSIRMSAPSPTFHISQFLIKGNAFTMAFHITDPFLEDFWSHMTQSMMEFEGNYFSLTMRAHKPVLEMIPQTFLLVNACANKWMFFNPQTPKYYGVDILFFKARTRGIFSSDPNYRKRKESWLILSRMPFGTQAREV